MIEVKLVDKTNSLANEDFQRLKGFIIDHCISSVDSLVRLEQVTLQDDGNENYLGYWSAQYIRDGADVRDVKAVIVLNAHYLKTVEQMEATLAHEFGHHWTLSHFMERYDMIGWFNERAPWLYYRIRGLDPESFAKDYEKGWSYCDKEVLAEDFKYRFSPYTGLHRMRQSVGNPTTEVADYIRSLGRPPWI